MGVDSGQLGDGADAEIARYGRVLFGGMLGVGHGLHPRKQWLSMPNLRHRNLDFY